MKKLIVIILISLFNQSFTLNQDMTNKIKLSLSKAFPKLSIDSITDTPLANIYQVTSNKKIFYVDSNVNYAFIGNLVDLNTKNNLTQLSLESLSLVDWNGLPIKIAIRNVNGDGQRKIAIFTDPDCPFCKRLEQETVPELKNVTIYYFLFPLAMHSEAESHAKQILCSENPESAFTSWMKDGKQLSEHTSCNNANSLYLMKNIAIKAGVEVAPTIVLPDGKIITGLVPADYLNQLITNSSPIIESSFKKSK